MKDSLYLVAVPLFCQLQEKHTVDFLQIQRLKKRKLVLKDKIAHIRNELEPDSIA